jgi:carbon-monoxide dehydrogenase large subunit
LTDAAFRKAEVTIKEMISYHRTHPSPLETCQCVCSFDKIRGELTIWGTFQAPHVIRTVVSLIAKLPEQKIHVISPDIRRRLWQQGRRLSRLLSARRSPPSSPASR